MCLDWSRAMLESSRPQSLTDAAFDAVRHPAALFDDQGFIIRPNAAWCAYMEVLGFDPLNLADLRDRLRLAEPRAEASRTTQEVTCGRRRFEFRQTDIACDGERYTLGEIHDISRLVKQSTRVRRQTADLLLKMRSRVTSVQNAITLVTDYDRAALGTDTTGLLNDARFELWQLARYATNFSDLALLQASELRDTLIMETARVADLIPDLRETVELVAEHVHASADNFSVSIDDDCLVLADRIRLTRILESLIINSMLYGEHDTLIELTCGADNDRVSLFVIDNGPGIDEESQRRIFTYGFKARGAGPDTYNGMGVELYLARQIVMHMNGMLTFTSSKGKGTTFELNLQGGC